MRHPIRIHRDMARKYLPAGNSHPGFINFAGMMKYVYSAGVLALLLVLVSWGRTGHRLVGLIAARHLTPQAQAGVKELLGHSSLADVSTWADEVVATPEYQSSAPWHYIDLPLGLTFGQFSQTIRELPNNNLYRALQGAEQILASPSSSKTQRIRSLNFIVHFVGDAHQPMHVSRGEDRGGNTIQVPFNGGSNLHKLWDSDLIEHQGLSEEKMVTLYDTATPEQISKWQHDPLMLWLWESYQISTILYQEAADGPAADSDYYKAHIPVVEHRVEQAGIRLAGVLNDIFANTPGTSNAR